MTEKGGSDKMSANETQKGQIVDLDFLRGLIAAVDESTIDSLEIARGGTKIRVSKTPASSGAAPAAPVAAAAPAPAPAPAPAAPAAAAPAPAAAAPAADKNAGLTEIKSPMVGTFYRSPNPDSAAYVEVGSRVVKGQTLCILEAMKLMNELEAEVEGVVREICIDNGEPVEYGQVLFRIEPGA